LYQTVFQGKWMPDSGFNRFAGKSGRRTNPHDVDLSGDKDMVMEQILENIHKTPLGQVLKRIASLPGRRQEKVLHLRRQITEGRYDLGRRLDRALDKVLEDLTT
jgi:hypothetical protein